MTQFLYQCVALIKIYPHMKIDDRLTYTSKENELNAKSNQKSDGQTDRPTDRAKA